MKKEGTAGRNGFLNSVLRNKAYRRAAFAAAAAAAFLFGVRFLHVSALAGTSSGGGASKTVVIRTADEEDFARASSELVKKKQGNVDRTTGEAKPYSSARLIVKVKDGKKVNFSKYSAETVVESSFGVSLVQFLTEKEARKAAKSLGALSAVSYVEPDDCSVNTGDNKVSAEAPGEDGAGQGGSAPGTDTIPGGSAAGTGSGQSNPATVRTQATDTVASTARMSWGTTYIQADQYAAYVKSSTKKSITVAVVDSGVSSHLKLQGRLLGGVDLVDNDSNPADKFGHGTSVAGVIVDCTPGINVKILSVRVLNSRGTGNISAIGNGIRYAVQKGAKVINLSLGAFGYSRYMVDCIDYANKKGVTVVVAAGNDNVSTAYICPAHISSVIVVGAINKNGKRASFSNYGSSLDVVAPGVDVKSCWVGGKYVKSTGTSMAAPHVSAAAAMYRLIYPSYTPAKIEKLVKEYSKDLGAKGRDNYYGFGVPRMKASIEPKKVSLNTKKTTLGVNSSLNLKATLTPSYAGMNKLTWSSSDKKVVTVSKGKVTAKKKGTAVITVRTVNGKTAVCRVTVTAPASAASARTSSQPASSKASGQTASTATASAKTTVQITSAASASSTNHSGGTGQAGIAEDDLQEDLIEEDSAEAAASAFALPAEAGLSSEQTASPQAAAAQDDSPQTASAPALSAEAQAAAAQGASPQAASAFALPAEAGLSSGQTDSSQAAAAQDDPPQTASAPAAFSLTGFTQESAPLKAHIFPSSRAGNAQLHEGCLYTGERLALDVEIVPAQQEAPLLEWESSEPSVAKVDENGVVTALKKGTAQIGASTAGQGTGGEKQTIGSYLVRVEDPSILTRHASYQADRTEEVEIHAVVKAPGLSDREKAPPEDGSEDAEGPLVLCLLREDEDGRLLLLGAVDLNGRVAGTIHIHKGNKGERKRGITGASGEEDADTGMGIADPEEGKQPGETGLLRLEEIEAQSGKADLVLFAAPAPDIYSSEDGGDAVWKCRLAVYTAKDFEERESAALDGDRDLLRRIDSDAVCKCAFELDWKQESPEQTDQKEADGKAAGQKESDQKKSVQKESDQKESGQKELEQKGPDQKEQDQEEAGRKTSGQEEAGLKETDQDKSDQKALNQGTSGQETKDQETKDQEKKDQDNKGQETNDQETKGQETKGQEKKDQDDKSQETKDQDNKGQEQEEDQKTEGLKAPESEAKDQTAADKGVPGQEADEPDEETADSSDARAAGSSADHLSEKEPAKE